MARKFSLQKRLGLGLTIGIAVLWLVAVTASGMILQKELDKVFDGALEETAQRILPLAVVEIINRDNPAASPRIASLGAHDEHLSYLVREENGTILLRSRDADMNVFGERPHKGFVTTATHRIYGTTAVSDTIYLEISEPLENRRAIALKASSALLWPLAVLIPVSLIGIWCFVCASLRSLRSYRDAIESKGAGDLSPVHTGQLPTEIEPIAVGVNRLLERLRRALEAERSFTANSAHELRTPLATALAQVQRLKRDAPAGALQDKTVEIEESLRGLSRLSEKIMQLAKAEGGGLLSEKPQDLVPVLALVVDELRYHAKIPIDLDLTKHGQILSTIDPDAFAILARNLIDNALKHGSPKRPVEISLGEGILRVANAGPVIPPEILEQIRHPFVRANTDTPGSGLGLAIAEKIASGVGAALLLHSPATDRSDGFEATFCFPATLLKSNGSVT